MSEVIEKVVNEIVEFNQFETNLAEFKKQYDGVVYDLTDPQQEKQAKSDRLSIGKVISLLDKTHKELKAPLKAKTDLIDCERKRIKDDLLGVQLLIKSQIEKHDKEIADKAEKLQLMVEEFELFSIFDLDVIVNTENITHRLQLINNLDVDDTYEHRKADATLAKVDSIKKLELMLIDAALQEEKDRELTRLQEEEAARLQKEREDNIAKEAAEKATREAEQAAQKKIDDAENDRIEAEKNAKSEIEAAEKAAQFAIDKANREKMEAENATKQANINAKRQATLAAQKERELIEEEQAAEAVKVAAKKQIEDAKKEKQAYRAKIHKQAKTDYMALGFSDRQATEFVNIIKDGKIKNIQIVY